MSGLYNARALSLLLAVSCSHGEPAVQSLALNVAVVPKPGADLPDQVQAQEQRKESASGAASTAGESAVTPCPTGMVLVEGEYCPEVEQTCLEWMDPPSSRYAHFRCKQYMKPSVCKGARKHMRYCIDKTERTEGTEGKPAHFVSFFKATDICAQAGGRVCRESEWQFACEGEEMRPYPYGFERDTTVCNTDRETDLKKNGRLVDHRSVAGSHGKCTSPFGVQDQAGNMEEWVAADGPSKMGWKQVLKGSWWIPSRHACRQFQIGHGPEYGGAEVGTRCCKDL
jgi:formylglycine-generating enzyme